MISGALAAAYAQVIGPHLQSPIVRNAASELNYHGTSMSAQYQKRTVKVSAPMSDLSTIMQSESARFKFAWISLAVIGVAIFVFGLVVTIWPGSTDRLLLRSIGVSSIGMGLFGMMITLIPFRHRERWAWFTLWFYPVFWLAHFIGRLPPGQDHIHQIVFIVLSLLGLLLSSREFFQSGMPR